MKVIYKPRGRAKEYSNLAVNLYRGCIHGCKYCFAPACLRMSRQEFHAISEPRKNILSLLEKDLKALSEQNSKERVLLCFTCDPYQGNANLNIFTRKALGLFRQYNIPFQMLTKGGMKAERDFDLYSEQDAFASTLTFFDIYDSRQWEPGASLPDGRIKALQKAKKRGITTWVSFEPVIDVDEVFKLFAMTADFVDLYKIGKCSGNYSRVDSENSWRAFALTMVDSCERYNKAYYIKKDLRKYLE